MILLYLLLFACLCGIAREDLKYRNVHTFWFLGLSAVLLSQQLIHTGFYSLLYRYATNIGFLVAQFLLLQVYFILKERRLVWIFDRYIGWGDVVFLLCIAGVWPLPGFLVFSIGSLFFSLLVYLLFIKDKHDSVPLAGLQAICLLVILVLEQILGFSFDTVFARYLFS